MPIPTPTMLLTDRLASHAAQLTASERGLADDLLRNYPAGLMDSASTIAGRTGTSASTVVRLFGKLGYASFAEVRREARSALTSRLQTAGQRVTATLGTERSLAECIDDALLHDQHNLQATRQGLDMETFTAVAQLLAQDERRVFVMAEKNSAPVGAHLNIHLNLCRPQVSELGPSAPMAVDRLLWTRPDDILLVFTIRRYSRGALLAAQQFRQQGATVIALTDSAIAPIVQHAQHTLLVHTDNASPFDSYTASFFLCNALISAVAQLRHRQVSHALQRRDALWTPFEADTLDGLLR